jgi:iron complex outermembrane receptor protein
VTSTTGFIKHDIEFSELDNDLTTVNSSSFPFIGLYAEQFTQEFTATADLGSRADIVAGAFYMHGKSSEPLYISTPPVDNAFVYFPHEQLDSYAIYAQFRYQLTDSLRATIGGRHTIDEKSFQIDANSRGTLFNNEADDKWDAFTPRFVLDYTPNENALIYASASRGFKSGGFNTLGDVSQPVNVFDPEYVWNYEVGVKATLMDRKLRMGLTGFNSDYTNLQQTVFRINPQTGVRYPKVENASTATIKGLELEIEAIPYPGLKLTGSATHLDGEYGQFFSIDPIFPELGNQDLGGNRTTQAPEWQLGASGEYNFPISATLEITARADYKWQSKVYFDIYNDALNVQDSYGLLNASIAVGSADQTWSISGWLRNAADERYLSQANVKPGAAPARAGSLGTPRMYGATLTYRF